MKFVKKPVVVEAEQFLGIGQGIKVPDGVKCNGPYPLYPAFISTLEGNMRVSPGDWIITGVAGEKYPCKPDIFEATYERVKEPTDQQGGA